LKFNNSKIKQIKHASINTKKDHHSSKQSQRGWRWWRRQEQLPLWPADDPREIKCRLFWRMWPDRAAVRFRSIHVDGKSHR